MRVPFAVNCAHHSQCRVVASNSVDLHEQNKKIEKKLFLSKVLTKQNETLTTIKSGQNRTASKSLTNPAQVVMAVL